MLTPLCLYFRKEFKLLPLIADVHASDNLIRDVFTLKMCSYLGQIGQNDLPKSWTVLGDGQNTVISDAVRTPTQVYLPQIRTALRHLQNIESVIVNTSIL